MRRLAPFHTLAFAFVALFAASASAQTLPSPKFGAQTINGNPSIPTCPAGNCPHPENGTGPNVLATQWIYGSTTQGSAVAEWLGVDGLYVNTGQPDGQKVTRYIGAVQGPLGGTTWALNTDVVRNGIPNGSGGLVGSSSPGTPGAVDPANGTVGYELDYTNWDRDSGPGLGAFTVGLYLHNQSTHTSLAAITMDNTSQGLGDGNPLHPAWADGILFNSPNLIKDNTIFDGTNGTFSYQVSGNHSVSFYDNSNSSYGLQVNGTHSQADIWLTDAAPYGVKVDGAHTNMDIWLADNAPVALNVSGTRATADINASGSGPAGIKVSGSHTAAISTTADSSAYALSAKAGQKVCLAALTACASYDTTAHKWYFTDEDNVVVFSVARTTGNAIFKGTVTPSGTP